jgi:hypothetical protein
MRILISKGFDFIRQTDLIMLKVIRLLLWCSAISLFIWAFINPQFRDAEGFLRGTFCFPISVGVALMILGFTVAGRLKRPAFWFTLALVGQAAALQMIEAGPRPEYQHYMRPIARLLTNTHPLLLIWFAMQTVFVLAGIGSRWPHVKTTIGRTFKIWQLSCVALVFFLSSATLSRYISDYLKMHLCL